MGAAVTARRRARAVHGLAGDAVAPDWPWLTAAELAPVAGAYPALGAVREIAWHSPRPFAASAIVTGAHGDVFVKRHHSGVRSVADLVEEHSFIAHLRHAGGAVPPVLATRDGATAMRVGDRVYEVHALGDGDDLYRDAASWSPLSHAAHARAAGAALASLHCAAAGYAAPRRGTGLLVADFAVFGAADPLAALQRRIDNEPGLAAGLAGRAWQADISRVLMPWHAALAPHLGALAPLWTHNDFHASNLLWRDAGAAALVSAVLDFGLSNRTSAIFDLATAIERNAVAWLRLESGETDIGRADLARELIRGYCATRPLAAGEAAALAPILPLVHAEFALSELAYFHGILRAPEKSALAYTVFLLGHAAWFSTGHGQAFLSGVRDACG